MVLPLAGTRFAHVVMARHGARVILMRSLFLLFPLCFPACASASNPNVYEARGFTSDEITVLQSAANEWCDASRATVCALVVEGSQGYETSTVTLTVRIPD